MAEEAHNVAIMSGGPSYRWRRKRGKAARLCPVGEDSSSTTRLFNGNGNGNGHANGHARGLDAWLPRRPLPEPEPPSEPPSESATPLLRYEWRSPSGETLVVEAGWPGQEPPAAPDVTRATGPGVDLRS